jgi:hypothetical protein
VRDGARAFPQQRIRRHANARGIKRRRRILVTNQSAHKIGLCVG